MTDPQNIPHVLYEDLPMAADRGAGWAKLRDLGPVLQGDGWYYLTNRDDVLAALRNPEVFSSTRAFDEMVSAVPLVPLAFDPQTQAAQIIGEIAQRDECEVMADLATDLVPLSAVRPHRRAHDREHRQAKCLRGRASNADL